MHLPKRPSVAPKVRRHNSACLWHDGTVGRLRVPAAGLFAKRMIPRAAGRFAALFRAGCSSATCLYSVEFWLSNELYPYLKARIVNKFGTVGFTQLTLALPLKTELYEV